MRGALLCRLQLRIVLLTCYPTTYNQAQIPGNQISELYSNAKGKARERKTQAQVRQSRKRTSRIGVSNKAEPDHESHESKQFLIPVTIRVALCTTP